MNKNYLAFDLGAESGRAIHGSISQGKLTLTEVYRFPNSCINIEGRFHWNIFHLFEELKTGLKIAVDEKKLHFSSIGIDTWGVDFGLFGHDGQLLDLPFAYRDLQTTGMIEKLTSEVISQNDLYLKTGIQLIQFNTIFQLYAMAQQKSPLVTKANDLLFMPDLLNYLFTDVKKSEFTIATTSQLMNPFTRDWDLDLIQSLGVNPAMMQEIVYPGTVIGNIKSEITNGLNLPLTQVVAVASHDTQSAIVAVPAEGKNWAYLSSGTWSLMGIETDKPIVNEKSAAKNYTNEGGAEGKFCFLKNMCGLWILQQCKKAWDDSFRYTYDQFTQMASTAEPFKIFIDTDFEGFYNPADMPKAIVDYCKQTNQPAPSNHAELIRSVLESMALKNKLILNELNTFSTEKIEKLFVIGGGAKNKLLCQFTSDAIGIPVVTGPSEATAVGNILIQAKALGHINSLDEMRTISKNSFESEIFLPNNTELWNKVFDRYCSVIK